MSIIVVLYTKKMFSTTLLTKAVSYRAQQASMWKPAVLSSEAGCA